MFQKKNFFVITGGPGAGKTSLLKGLSEKGFPTVPESGRTIIRERLALGLPPRPGPAEFARVLLKKDRLNYFARLESDEVIFFDRSFLDSAYLLRLANPADFKSVDELVSNYRFNDIVFIAPPWRDIYHNDEERDQSFEEALRTHDGLAEWYKSQGYVLNALPKTGIDERIGFILHSIIPAP